MLRRLFALLCALSVVLATGCDYYVAPRHAGPQAAPAPSASHAPPAPSVPQDTVPGRAVVERGHRLGYTPTFGAAGQVQVSGTNGEPYSDAHLTYNTSGTGALAVAADGTGYMSIGNGTLPAAGQLRVPNATTIIQSVTAGGSAMPVLKTDASNEIYIGDTAGANAYVQITAYYGVTLSGWDHTANAVWGGINSFSGKSGWKQTQLAAVDEPSSGDASNGQWWFDTQSRPKAIDAQSNQMQMGTLVWALAAAATTTNATATSTNLTWTMGASDEWAFRWEPSMACSTNNGVDVGISVPAGATVRAQAYGGTTTTAWKSCALSAGGLTGCAFVTDSTDIIPITLVGTVKGDGTHGGAVTMQYAAHTGGDTATVEAHSPLRAWQVTKEL